MVQRKTLTSSDFVHLHNHTQYSLLDGLTKIPALMETVKKFGMTSVAITDHGTLSGLIEFYKEANQTDIKPLLGIETYIAARGLKDKDSQIDKENYHLILIAMNNEGYKNLMRLSSIANLDGYYYKPRIDHETLAKYNKGLIVLSGCMGSELGSALSQGLTADAETVIKWYKETFNDRYYLEVQDHGHPLHPTHNERQETINNEIFKLAKKYDLPTVITADCHYLKHTDQTAHEILLCIQTNSFLSDENRLSLIDLELHVTDPKEIIKRWGKDHPESITNTKEVSESCHIEIELGRYLIPKFPLPAGQSDDTFLKLLVYKGLSWRYGGASRDRSPQSIPK